MVIATSEAGLMQLLDRHGGDGARALDEWISIGGQWSPVECRVNQRGKPTANYLAALYKEKQQRITNEREWQERQR